MKLRQMLIFIMILPMIFIFTNCSEEAAAPTPINESEVLLAYLEANGDFINGASCPAMTTATDVYNNLIDPSPTKPSYFVMDIRTASDFTTKGHIKGAVQVDLANVLDYYEANNLANYNKVIITCYSGQTAGFATGLLRLMGYNNVWDMKYGMCAWNDTVANSWGQSIGNSRAASFVTTAAPKAAAGNLPVINTGKTTGAEILRARVQYLLKTAGEGFDAAKINHTSVYTNLTNYYIVNYWTQAHYDWGHIDGSIQYTPKADLKSTTFLKTLPTNKPVVIYCYTGQTSAHIVAFLRVLGYDAKSLLYGVNSMSYDNMPASKFNPAADILRYPFIK